MNARRPRQTSTQRSVSGARWLCAWAALAGAQACGDPITAETGSCRQDTDCATGMRCFEETWCVAVPAEAQAVTLQLAPPPGSGGVVEYFSATLGGPGSHAGATYQLSLPAAVRGTVTRANDPLAPSIPGRLIALAPGKIVGTALRYETTSYATLKTFGDEAIVAGFEMRLQVGPHYDVSFWPDNHDIPPWFDGWMVAGSADGWTVELPAAAALMKIRGRFVHGEATPVDCQAAQAAAQPGCVGACEGAAGLRVLLRDADGHQRSSRAITDETGAFEMVIDASAGEVEVVFAPSSAAVDAPAGRLTRRLDLPALRKKELLDIDLGTLVLGPRSAAIDADIPIRDAEGAPVIGVIVQAERALPAPLACTLDASGKPEQAPLFQDLRVQAHAISDAEGVARWHAPGGSWKVALTPPFDSTAARWQSASLTIAAGVNPAIICPKRRRLAGYLQAFDLRPIAGARIRVSAVSADTLTLAPTVVEANVGADGAFELWLDPGTYAMVAEPPAESGMARALFEVIDIGPEHDPPSQLLVLPAPAVLVGRVLSPLGLPQAGVVVEVLAPTLSALPSLGAGRRAEPSATALLATETQRMASALTDAQGRFRVLVATGQIAPDP